MKDIPNLNELSKIVFEANKAKGFHEEEHSNEHYLCLVISELMEAVEADRKGKVWRPDECERMKEYNYHLWYNTKHKGSVAEELADAVIRLLDLAGSRGCEPCIYDRAIRDTKDQFGVFELLSERIYHIITHVMRPSRYEHPQYIGIINYTISAIVALCDILSIDLWLHVELKMKYNETRPHKHGKEY